MNYKYPNELYSRIKTDYSSLFIDRYVNSLILGNEPMISFNFALDIAARVKESFDKIIYVEQSNTPIDIDESLFDQIYRNCQCGDTIFLNQSKTLFIFYLDYHPHHFGSNFRNMVITGIHYQVSLIFIVKNIEPMHSICDLMDYYFVSSHVKNIKNLEFLKIIDIDEPWTSTYIDCYGPILSKRIIPDDNRVYLNNLHILKETISKSKILLGNMLNSNKILIPELWKLILEYFTL